MTRAFISYAHTAADTDLAEHLEFWLDRQGVKVWRDKTGMPAGAGSEEMIDRQIHQADAAIFLVSHEWKERYWTRWELERLDAHVRKGARIARIGVYRVPIDELPYGRPPELVGHNEIHWYDGVHDKGACFWQLLHGVRGDFELGLEHTWKTSGALLVPDIPRDGRPSPRPSRKPALRKEKASLECGRGKEWTDVGQMYKAAEHHQISFIAAQRHEAHATFVERIEKKLIESNSPPIRRVSWLTRPVTEPDFLQPLATALSPRGEEASIDELPELFEQFLAESNAVLLHDLIDSRFDDPKLIRYYTEWLPKLLPKNADSHRLKCVQPVAWTPGGAGSRLRRRVSAALKLKGLFDWFATSEEELARRFITNIGEAGGDTVKSLAIDLPPIDEPDVRSLCDTRGFGALVRSELIRRTRRGERIRTSEDVLAEIDNYFEEHPAAGAGEQR